MKPKPRTKPLRGKALAYAVLRQITEHPETWQQDDWHSECKTCHCFGGHAQIMGGNVASPTARLDAIEFLGIRENQGYILFFPNNKLEQLERIVREIFGPPSK
jgi:hypothetical protein